MKVGTREISISDHLNRQDPNKYPRLGLPAVALAKTLLIDNELQVQ